MSHAGLVNINSMPVLFGADSVSGIQMRGGGVIHGPVVRSHEHSLNRKVRRLGLKCALAVSLPSLATCSSCSGTVLDDMLMSQAKTLEGRLHVFDSLDVADAKTVRLSCS